VVDGTLVGQLFGSGGDGGEGLEEFSPGLSESEFVCSLDGGIQVLLDKGDTFSGQFGSGVDSL
jgi:hypothetical protein